MSNQSSDFLSHRSCSLIIADCPRGKNPNCIAKCNLRWLILHSISPWMCYHAGCKKPLADLLCLSWDMCALLPIPHRYGRLLPSSSIPSLCHQSPQPPLPILHFTAAVSSIFPFSPLCLYNHTCQYIWGLGTMARIHGCHMGSGLPVLRLQATYSSPFPVHSSLLDPQQEGSSLCMALCVTLDQTFAFSQLDWLSSYSPAFLHSHLTANCLPPFAGQSSGIGWLGDVYRVSHIPNVLRRNTYIVRLCRVPETTQVLRLLHMN